MKRLIMTLLITATVCIGIPEHRVSAHVLAENNGVSAVLHIPPFDAPQANQPTALELQFGADAGQFHLTDYKISLAVAADGKQVTQRPVEAAFLGAAVQGKATVDFPKAAVYDLRLTGTPVTSGKPRFAMSYTVRVVAGAGAATAAKSNNASQIAFGSVAVFILFMMVAARQIISGGRYAKQTKPQAV